METTGVHYVSICILPIICCLENDAWLQGSLTMYDDGELLGSNNIVWTRIQLWQFKKM